MISQWYDPEEGSAAVPGAIARSLAGHGHEVHVLTGFPNYPTGRIYPGYRQRPYQFESRDGINVHRVPLVANHDRSAVRRAANYLSFAGSAALRPRLLGLADVWLVYSSPATAALPALAALVRHLRPYVLLIQDLWPDSVTASGFTAPGRATDLVAGALHRFCDLTYRRAAAIAVTAPGMAEILAARGVPASRLHVVPNWVDERMFRPVDPQPQLAAELGLSGFVAMYAGNLGELQDLETAIEAVGLLDDLPDFTLAMVGAGVAEPRLRAMAARLPEGRVRFVGRQPVSRMAQLMALGDVQLVSLRDLPLLRATLPSKVQATLAAGRPVVAAVCGDASRLVTDSGAGFTVPPGDAGALAAALRRMVEMGRQRREQLGRLGRAYYLDRLSERVNSTALSGLLCDAAGAATARRIGAAR
jgi:glycosyltransferase involved in cell wall biosynthesis